MTARMTRTVADLVLLGGGLAVLSEPPVKAQGACAEICEGQLAECQLTFNDEICAGWYQACVDVYCS